jgi:nucleoid-associated protein YgaU
MRKPKLIAALLVGGTALLVGGTAVAVSLPSHGKFWRADAQVAPSAASRAPASALPTAVGALTPAPTSPTSPTAAALPPLAPTVRTATPRAASAKTTPAPAKGPITYTVKPGDTLSGIAAWFNLHGYGSLYAANAAVIGGDPNLIKPGERITLGTGVMTLQPPA